MTEPVAYSVTDRIAVLRVQNPPVNALSQAVRAGLDAGLARALADDGADAILILGDGRTFIAGADISEFGKPLAAPGLPDVVNRIEAAGKPVVAALHGTALGGGLEVALGAHYRVAVPGAKVGLPEVLLGILPGAGGTQRTPRLTGAEAALDMITTGKHISATEALRIGLIDAIEDGSPEEAGLRFTRRLLVEGAGPRPTRGIAPAPHDPALFDAWRAKVAAKTRGQIAPVTCVDAVEAAFTLPFDAGLKRERELFSGLMASPQREGLIHAFFIERKVGKLPEIAGVTPRDVAWIGVIGGGTMGAGIAAAALLNGLSVTLVEQTEAARGAAHARIAGILGDSVARGKLTEPARDTLLGDRLTCVTEYAALADADLVIEAAFEDMAVKKTIFTALDQHCKPGAILATNTSYLDINEIAAVTARPGDVIGLHFFSPAHVMRLLEVVVAEHTAPEVTATGFALAKRLKKVAVRAGVCDGFIGNRILASYRMAADHMVLEGATPYAIDAAMVDFGFAMGPFAVSDLAGLDIGWATRKRLAPLRHPNDRIAKFADMMCEEGWFGRKTGRGFYDYTDPKRPVPNPQVAAMIDADRAARGITPRAFTAEDIQRRYMAAMINEAAKVVGDGIAARPLDVDVTLLYGYGFPRWRGGPMKYADMRGLPSILADIEAFAQDDPHFWHPAPLLTDLVARGASFDSLNG
ncbi:3-hydroxyacyl-CoA dehydrogenase [Rubricella aquisinus]|uniref:3-hydroxyacyl-CoA dehydrogenase n=1 Tax=Rubricella aquisinus TaxID=2028108 RepID=A0A840WG86_9RHOB|nr:3-hydroxyacyl-CoA dehydrogenase NAD-binding domain-containing protein [Rubricella aquisinus]MBB5514168.1 3-hydroxyacyl-CoA dehydrogenase [Rubricella aquisinus]